MCVDEPSAANRDPMARNNQKPRLFNSQSVLSRSQVASVRWIAVEICDKLDVVTPLRGGLTPRVVEVGHRAHGVGFSGQQGLRAQLPAWPTHRPDTGARIQLCFQ